MHKAWCRGWPPPSPVGNLFGLGSTLYYIATSTAPFRDIKSDEGLNSSPRTHFRLLMMLVGGMVRHLP